jgi:5'-3' exonuclease
MQGIAFVDLSYYVFFRYFALLRWSKISNNEFLDDENGHKMFLAKFSKLFEDNLVALKKKHKFDWSSLYLVKDCVRSTIWRLELFSKYKQNRDESNRQAFDPKVFVHTYQELVPALMQKYGFNIIEYPKAEADDVIAVIHGLVRNKQPDRKVLIITNDNDYVQLVDDNTTIMNLNKIILSERFDAQMLSCFKIWKVIKGDVSDNIPPIDKNIGDKTALKLALNPDMLKKKLLDPRVRDQFELNLNLIDFDMIPRDLVNGIKASFNKFNWH